MDSMTSYGEYVGMYWVYGIGQVTKSTAKIFTALHTKFNRDSQTNPLPPTGMDIFLHIRAS